MWDKELWWEQTRLYFFVSCPPYNPRCIMTWSASKEVSMSLNDNSYLVCFRVVTYQHFQTSWKTKLCQIFVLSFLNTRTRFDITKKALKEKNMICICVLTTTPKPQCFYAVYCPRRYLSKMFQGILFPSHCFCPIKFNLHQHYHFSCSRELETTLVCLGAVSSSFN